MTPITPVFGARVEGLDVTRPLTDSEFAGLRRALDDHGVLVLPGQPLDDDAQVELSERFGPLERTVASNPAAGTAFARQSNLDVADGTLIPADDARMRYQRGNQQWHADSTFKPVRSLCSLLSARVVPPTGGDTEFASTAAAWMALEPALQARLALLCVEHSLVASRRRAGFEFTDAVAATLPCAIQPLVLANPVTGRRSLLIGAHAMRLIGEGVPEDGGALLLDELLAIATRPEHVFRHRWQAHDLVIWDNRACLHRATPYDEARHARLMQRTTVSDPSLVTPAVATEESTP